MHEIISYYLKYYSCPIFFFYRTFLLEGKELTPISVYVSQKFKSLLKHFYRLVLIVCYYLFKLCSFISDSLCLIYPYLKTLLRVTASFRLGRTNKNFCMRTNFPEHRLLQRNKRTILKCSLCLLNWMLYFLWEFYFPALSTEGTVVSFFFPPNLFFINKEKILKFHPLFFLTYISSKAKK